MYLINFTDHNKRFCYVCIIIKKNGYLFVTGTKIIKFKSKDPESLAHLLCLGNISKDCSVDNTKKKRDSTDIFMILVLIMMLLHLMIFRHS